MKASTIDVRLASGEPVEIDWSAAGQIVDIRRQVGEKLRVPWHQVKLLDGTGIVFEDNENLNHMIEAASVLVVLEMYDDYVTDYGALASTR